jgi:hypothetical protein
LTPTYLRETGRGMVAAQQNFTYKRELLAGDIVEVKSVLLEIRDAVILTGIMGAIIVTPLMNRIGMADFRARGFAVGIAAHGIGTARAFQVDVALNALVTSSLVPLAATLLVR